MKNNHADALRYAQWHAQDCFAGIDFYLWDGESEDGTDRVLAQFPRLQVLRGTDSGLYDAWNRLVDRVWDRYDYLCFLGIDDRLGSEVPARLRALGTSLAAADGRPDLLYGDLVMLRGDTWRYLKAGHYPSLTLQALRRNVLPHPGLWHRARLFERLRFDRKLRVVADYKLLLEAARMHGALRVQHLNCVQAVVGVEGLSNREGQLGVVQRELRELGRDFDVRDQYRAARRIHAIRRLLGASRFIRLRNLAWRLRGSRLPLRDASRPRLVAHVMSAGRHGGAELALAAAVPALQSSLDLSAVLLARQDDDIGLARFSIPLRRLLRELLFNRAPLVVVTSLWKTYWVGALARLLGKTWALFLHSEKREHLADAVAGWAAERFCTRILADSHASRQALPVPLRSRTDLVPHFFSHELRQDGMPGNDPRSFLFVGRAVALKRLDLILQLLEQLVLRGCVGAADFYGEGTQSDPGLLAFQARFPGLVGLRGVENRPAMLGRYGRYGFIFMLSDHEGFSMSTFEAMRAGCVPIARAVGEPRYYCDADNAIIVDPASPGWADAAAEQIAALQSGPALFRARSARARSVASKYPGDYVRCYVEAIEHCLAGGAG
ncbi:MAG TPA: glycosyltransferase [Nevskiales bacterium]|nr:glycosyltransferase [Nevskiales bacterium]